MKNKKRSPFFYVGDKYKLMPQIIELFPENIRTYYEPFLGGGSSILHVEAQKYMLNDINEYIISLHSYIKGFSSNPNELFEILYSLIEKYKLSCSYLGYNVPEELKKRHIKTYYSKYNKESYLELRKDYNTDKKLSKLYLLLIYGFNHMTRFNSKGEFNLPVGNVDFNKNVFNALNNYLEFVEGKNIEYSSIDYIDFISQQDFKEGDYVYLDPPYLISSSEYNKNWTENDEEKLYSLVDKLDAKGVKFGLSNVTDHKGVSNNILKSWMNKYTIFNIKSNYISRFDNSIKEDTKEVFITNYEKNRE